MKRKPKTKFKAQDSYNIVGCLERCSNLKYVAHITNIPITKVRQVKEALRIKRS